MSRQRRAAPSISAEAPTARAPEQPLEQRAGAARPRPAARRRGTAHAVEAHLGPAVGEVDARPWATSVTPGGRRVDEEEREALGRARGHQHHVGHVGPRHEALDAGERPARRRVFAAVAVVDAGSQSSESSSSAAVRARLAGGDGGQPLLLLRRACRRACSAEAAQHHGRRSRARDRRRAPSPRARAPARPGRGRRRPAPRGRAGRASRAWPSRPRAPRCSRARSSIIARTCGGLALLVERGADGVA